MLVKEDRDKLVVHEPPREILVSIPSVIDVTRHHTHTQIMTASVATVVAALDDVVQRIRTYTEPFKSRSV